MPLNILRLNQKHLHPNERIAFIKPLPNLSTTAKAELFLQKIAAQCYPIMKAHSLSITSLDEFPPNREFMGRNFNGGEVIQLVLRRMPIRRWDQGRQGFISKSDLGENGVVVHGNRGRLDPHSTEFVAERDGQDDGWLSFRAVQAVMMHELAHCIEMNHSKAFWKVRNIYMDQLKILWQQGYLGEGVWGRGQRLQQGDFETGDGGHVHDVEGLCGGAYRGRGTKRGKNGKEKVTYAERKKRKLAKTESKFGQGRNVGENESMKVALEGKFKGSKPRVANSKRGRELRAAAALARFDVNKQETKEETQPKDEETETETESDVDGLSDEELTGASCLVDADGVKVQDAKGNDLFKICDDTDIAKDKDAQNEFDELKGLVYQREVKLEPAEDEAVKLEEVEELPTYSTTNHEAAQATNVHEDCGQGKELGPQRDLPNKTSSGLHARSTGTKESTEATTSSRTASGRGCPICSLENEFGSAVCMACSHVLRRDQIPDSWECKSATCMGSGYVNIGDAGICGVCGSRKV